MNDGAFTALLAIGGMLTIGGFVFFLFEVWRASASAEAQWQDLVYKGPVGLLIIIVGVALLIFTITNKPVPLRHCRLHRFPGRRRPRPLARRLRRQPMFRSFSPVQARRSGLDKTLQSRGASQDWSGMHCGWSLNPIWAMAGITSSKEAR